MPSELYLGLMSGTSLDAIDAVLLDCRSRPRLVASLSLPLEPELRETLLALCQPGDEEIFRMGIADVAMANALAHAANCLMQEAGCTPDDIAAIGSHGQTVRHHPESGFTLQLGDPNLIAELTNCHVVADFRRRDIAAGGQGAPLVPAFHAAMLRQPGEHRCVLNLGGMANISWLDADARRPVLGFDTGPANVLMDGWMQAQLHQPMDRNGQLAQQGRIIETFLEQLMQHPYLSLPPPKSTGRETFNQAFLQSTLDSMDGVFSHPDIMRTLLEFTARSIAQSVLDLGQQGRLIACGGGSYNPLLMQRLQALLPCFVVETSSAHGIEPQWMEAMAFAWLAWARLHGQPGNVPSVTGARGLRCLGGLYSPTTD